MTSAIVLAAGRSARMGEVNKLLLPWQGRPLVAQVAAHACASTAGEVIAVTGFQHRAVAAALAHLPVRAVFNELFVKGLTSSIQTGLRAAAPGARGYMLCLADQPLVSSSGMDALIGAFTRALRHDTRAIVRAHGGNQPGHPVVFSSAYRSAMLAHADPAGCQGLLHRHRAHVVKVQVAYSTLDIDTASDYALLQSAHRPAA